MPFHNLADPTRKLRRALEMKTILGQDRPDQPFPGLPDDIRKFLPLPGKGFGREPLPHPGQPDPSRPIPPGAITKPVEPPRDPIVDPRIGEPQPKPGLPPRSGEFPIRFPIHGIPEVPEDPVNLQPSLPAPSDPDDSAQEDLKDRLEAVFVQIARLRLELKNNLQDGEPSRDTAGLQQELIRLQALAQQLSARLGTNDPSNNVPHQDIPEAAEGGAFADAKKQLGSTPKSPSVTVPLPAEKIRQQIKLGKDAMNRLNNVIKHQEDQLSHLIARDQQNPGAVGLPIDIKDLVSYSPIVGQISS
jgi:hypothetical protein